MLLILTGENLSSICPLLNTASSIWPPSNQSIIPELEFTTSNVVTRRYVFNPTKISELKAAAAAASTISATSNTSKAKPIQNPSRVEVVTSLIYKTIIQSNKKIHPRGLVTSYSLAQTVNMRTRMVPPLPKNTVGNIVWYFPVMIKEEDDISLGTLAARMRDALMNLCEFARNVEGEKWLLMAGKIGVDGEHSMDDAYTFSSWCKHPVYDVDFGWGKPVWVSTAVYPYKNNVVMMDCKDGEGVEVWVTLDEDLMCLFEGDEEFLKFASFNPSI
ncbi:hypothetical protein SOVF_006070 [Spinacia oleracea]|nr:hypothetical protein SOVF_006070 [Spinacia oleracea]